VQFQQGRKREVSGTDSKFKAIEDLLSEQNSKGFEDQNLPLWRIIVLNLGSTKESSSCYEYAITFVYHHVIADGKSGQAIHYAILHELNSATGNSYEDDRGAIVVPSAKTLLPSMDEIVSYRTSWLAWIQKALPGFLQRETALDRSRWAGEPHHIEDHPKTCIRLIGLSKDATFNLVDLCRSHKTSMTALLQAVVGMTLFENLPDAQQLRCATAISLRRFLPSQAEINDSKIGLWIDGWHQDFLRSKLLSKDAELHNVSWSETVKNKARINYEIAKGEYDLGFADLRGTSDFKPGLLGKLGKARENSYSIVNLGICENSGSEKSWKLNRMIISQSAHVNGSAIQFCIVSTVLGGMMISLNWQDGTVTEEFTNKVVDSLEANLLRLARFS
jgi:hypothetical protein